jgi:hypothetical protein
MPILLILLSACTAVKTGKIRAKYNNSASTDIKEVLSKNISNSDFYIEKAEIKISVNGEKQNLFAFVKYKMNGLWLVSLKSRTGIEFARARISSDSLLINDRMNKKLYVGISKEIEDKYGIPFKMLPILFGDIVLDNEYKPDSITCTGGISNIQIRYGSVETEYSIGCKAQKAVRAIIKSSQRKNMEIYYSGTKTFEGKEVPERITIKDANTDSIIEIWIKNINFKNIERIDFTPGREYKKILVK